MHVKGVLILNRRCIRHPEKGGSEAYTLDFAKILIEQGHNVEWFSSRANGLKDREEIEGIRFVRKGNELTTHFHGLLYALKRKEWLIVDVFNGIGFFTFFMKNSIILIFQTYNEFWTTELGTIGYPFKLIEKILLRLYRNKPAITISDSTSQDLREIGFTDVKIIHPCITINPLDHVPEKESTLKLVYLGRLKKTKNPEDAIRAFLLVREKIKDAKLCIVGDGPLSVSLKEKYKNEKGVFFLGYLNNEKKYEYLKKAHFLLIPSIREGWGMVVIEANAMGTPAIGYKVKGLQDSIKDGDTGILVSGCEAMALKVLEHWTDRQKYYKLCKQALEWAREFSQKKTRQDFMTYLDEERPHNAVKTVIEDSRQESKRLP